MRFSRVWCLAALMACDPSGGGGGDDTPDPGQPFQLLAINAAGSPRGINLEGTHLDDTQAYAVDGNRVIAIGTSVNQDGTGTFPMVAAFEPGVGFAFAKRVGRPDTIVVNPSAVVPDGTGGVYVAGETAAPVLTEPFVSHWDASGNLLWAKGYPGDAPYWNIAIHPVQISEPTGGKIAILGGRGLAVIDTAGVLQWSKAFTGNIGLHQVVTDASGFLVFARLDERVYLFRYTWDGTQEWAKSALLFSQNSAPVVLYPVHRRADGKLMLTYDANDGADFKHHAGVIVLDPGGAIIDHWGYALDGSVPNPEGRSGLDDYNQRAPRVIADNRISTFRRFHIPYPIDMDHEAHIVFEIGPDGTPTSPDRWSFARGPFVQTANKTLVTLGDTLISSMIGTGPFDAPCSHLDVEIRAITRVTTGLEPLMPIEPDTRAPMPMTVTPQDVPLQLTDLGPVTTQPAANYCSVESF